MNDYLQRIYLGNTIAGWLTAAGILLVAAIAIRLFMHIVLKKLNDWALRTKTTWDNFIVKIIRSAAVPVLYISTIYFALKTLTLRSGFMKVLHAAYLIVLAYFALRSISGALRKFVYVYIRSKGNH